MSYTRTHRSGAPAAARRAGPALAAAATLVVGAASAEVRFVDDDAVPGGDGTAWSAAFVHLQDGLAAAAADPQVTEIRVAGGLYRPDAGGGQAPGDRFATFTLLDGVAVRGGYQGAPFGGNGDLRDIDHFLTVLSGDLAGDDGPGFANDGENSLHVVTAIAVGPSALLEGFTVTGGHADLANGVDEHGAGMLVLGGPAVVRCRFEGNRAAGRGGGMSIDHAAPEVRSVLFVGNAAASGAGLASTGPGADPLVIACAFLGNTAEGPGGGGGAGNSLGCAPSFVNCLFSGNAAVVGGGMRNDANAAPALHDCTFTGNAASFAGGGLSSSASVLVVNNCILWGDTAAAFAPEIHNELGALPILRFCDVQGSGGSGPGWNFLLGVDVGGNLDVDPLLADPAGPDGTAGTPDDDARPLPGSPVIDAGDDLAVPVGVTSDLDGNPRFVDDPATPDTGIPNGFQPVVDLGAYELVPPVIVPGDASGDGVVNAVDLVTVILAMGACPDPPAPCPADLDGSGAVDLADLFMVIQNWTPGVSAATGRGGGGGPRGRGK